jgi:hypothetical protein
LRRPVLWLLLALSLIVTAASMHALHGPAGHEQAVQKKDIAFLQARWGMRPDEVGKANGIVLEPAIDSQHIDYDPQADTSRYRSYEQREAKFLGRGAKITYTFHDGHLATYRVFLSDPNGERLDADMRRYLTRVFGDKASEQEEGSPLKLVWQFKDRIVNYWFMREELSLRSKYIAGFGVSTTDS